MQAIRLIAISWVAALLAVFPMSIAIAQEKGKVEVLWLGHAAARVTTVSGKEILIDPWLSANPKTPPEYRKLTALRKVDLILVTNLLETVFAVTWKMNCRVK